MKFSNINIILSLVFGLALTVYAQHHSDQLRGGGSRGGGREGGGREGARDGRDGYSRGGGRDGYVPNHQYQYHPAIYNTHLSSNPLSSGMQTSSSPHSPSIGPLSPSLYTPNYPLIPTLGDCSDDCNQCLVSSESATCEASCISEYSSSSSGSSGFNYGYPGLLHAPGTCMYQCSCDAPPADCTADTNCNLCTEQGTHCPGSCVNGKCAYSCYECNESADCTSIVEITNSVLDILIAGSTDTPAVTCPGTCIANQCRYSCDITTNG